MIRELIDTAVLEDFAAGLSRTGGQRLCVYDVEGSLVAAAPPLSAFAKRGGRVLGKLPRQMEMTRLPAHEPPANIGFVEDRGVWYVVAPVYIHDKPAGYVSLGEFRPPESHRVEAPDASAGAFLVESGEMKAAWEQLPPLDRSAEGHAVQMVRWAARMLSEWCRREERLNAAVEELSLVGDIAELLSGERDLQTMLDRVVAETARVMKVPYASLRLYDPRTDELSLGAVQNLPDSYLSKGKILRSENPIDDEAMRGRIVYIEDVQTDPRIRFPDQARSAGIVSGLTAGMIYRGRAVGVIRIYSDRRQRFRTAQRNLLRAVASQAAVAIVHARMLAERLKAAEVERELALAGDLQARMLRIPPPKTQNLELASIFDPSSHVGGDFCDFFMLADGRLAAVVADVVGKGVPASLLMASVRGAMRAAAECTSSLAELMNRLNRHVCRETLVSEFVTLLLLAIDSAGRRLSYCNAGHEPLLLCRDGAITRPDNAGIVLGVAPDEQYEETHLDLAGGDFLLMYTDGAIDALNFEGAGYGRERLFESTLTHSALGAQPATRSIHWDIRRFIGLAERSDDLTLVGIRVK